MYYIAIFLICQGEYNIFILILFVIIEI